MGGRQDAGTEELTVARMRSGGLARQRPAWSG